ncbi:MAG: hypothetical protein JRJ75_10970 [Deltaproteobacteria bacterium]|nr:hypothetical protein [Deltaproteobacteria bacterium]
MRAEFSVTSELNIVSYKNATRSISPPPHDPLTLLIDDRIYQTCIRDLRRSGATSIGKTLEQGVPITRRALCRRHNLRIGDRLLIEVEEPFMRYRLLRRTA